MAKYTKSVEAIQFLPKEDDKQHEEVIINGASHILHATDYAVYEQGQIVSVQSAAKFEAEHTEVIAEPKKAKK